MKARLFRSVPASVITVVMIGAVIILVRLANINSWLEILGKAGTFSPCPIVVLCFVTALFFGAFYAREWKIVSLGIVVDVALYMLLQHVDPAAVAFLMVSDRYEADVANIAGTEPKFRVFKLKEDFGFPSGGAWDYIVFDASDEIGLVTIRRTEEWQKLHGSLVIPATSQCQVKIRRLQGHFFHILQQC